MKTLQEKLNALAPARRKAIKERAAILIAEEMTLRELRKAQKITQVQLAKKLGIKQEQVSRTERQTDIHLSTLTRSVEAMGGTLTLVAQFPDGAPVRLTGFADLRP